jgi:hypothetical protein
VFLSEDDGPMSSNTNPRLRDVVDAFKAIQTRNPVDVALVGTPGTELIHSHVQGVARLADGYLLTHSNVDGADGCLLVDDGSHTVRTFPLPQGSIDGLRLSHPGGCQRIGNYLAIAFESVPANRNVSRVVFFDVSHSSQPMALATPPPIERRDQKAAGVGVANLTLDRTDTAGAGSTTEFWFVAVYDNGRVDLYRSDGQPFPDTAFALQFSDTIPDGYEGFCLLAEESNHLFAIGFRRDSRGRDKAELYAIHLDAEKLELLESREFHTKAIENVHFRWGSGVEVRSRDALHILVTGRNFLPLPFAAMEGDAPPSEDPAPRPATETGLIRAHCHVNTFSH